MALFSAYTTCFINEEDIRNNTTIQKNVQSDILTGFILPAQRLYILRILDKPLYEQLQSDVANNTFSGSVITSGLTQANRDLLTMVKDPLIFACAYEAVDFLQNRITNKGIELKASKDISNPSPQVAVDNIRENFRKYLEFYMEELKRFLRVNKTTYPNWVEEGFHIYTQYSGATFVNGTEGYFSGIELNKSYYWRPDMNYPF